MNELIETISNLPVSTLIVFAGLVFLLLSIAGRISTVLSVPASHRGQAMILGVLLLAVGVGLGVLQDRRQPMPTETEAVTTPPETDRETEIWMIQFGLFDIESNAVQLKADLEQAGLDGIRIVSAGDFPKLVSSGYYVVHGPAKESQINSYIQQHADEALDGTDYWIRIAY